MNVLCVVCSVCLCAEQAWPVIILKTANEPVTELGKRREKTKQRITNWWSQDAVKFNIWWVCSHISLCYVSSHMYLIALASSYVCKTSLICLHTQSLNFKLAEYFVHRVFCTIKAPAFAYCECFRETRFRNPPKSVEHKIFHTNWVRVIELSGMDVLTGDAGKLVAYILGFKLYLAEDN